MAKQRYINTKMWEDAWFSKLDPIEKLFFIYLLTNPMTNIAGVYELSKGTIGRSTGLESRVVDEILNRFEEAEKVIYRDGWVVILNFIKHQNYNSPKILIGIKSEIENIPENIVILIKNQLDRYGIDTISHSNLIKYNIIANAKDTTPTPIEDDLPEKIRTMWNNFKEWQSLGIDKLKIRNPSVIKKLLPEFRKVTQEFKLALKKRNVNVADADIAIKNYIRDIVNRIPDKSTFYEHRFSCYEFFKQENGFIKFLNK